MRDEFWATYRRSGINPFWPTLAVVIVASAMAGVFASKFDSRPQPMEPQRLSRAEICDAYREWAAVGRETVEGMERVCQ